jgi:hypothetical protein
LRKSPERVTTRECGLAPLGADAGTSSAPTGIVPLLLADATFRAELEGLVREARRAEAVFVCHDAEVVGAWERLADRLDLVQRAYVLWKAQTRDGATQSPAARTGAG